MSLTYSLLIQVSNLGPARAASESPGWGTQSPGTLAPPPSPSSRLKALPGSREGVKCFWWPRAVSAAVPPSGAAAAEVGQECLQCRARREGGLVEVGACGGWPGQAPQLSNRLGPAGSCNSCPSRLFPPCQLPPPTACQAMGEACTPGPVERGGGMEAQRAWRPGVKGRGFQRDRVQRG